MVQTFPAATHAVGSEEGIEDEGIGEGEEVGATVGERDGIGVVGILVGGFVAKMHLDSIQMLSDKQHSVMGSPPASTSQTPPAGTHDVGLTVGGCGVDSNDGAWDGIGVVGIAVGIAVGGFVRKTHLESTQMLSDKQHSVMGSPTSSTSQIPPAGTQVLGSTVGGCGIGSNDASTGLAVGEF